MVLGRLNRVGLGSVLVAMGEEGVHEVVVSDARKVARHPFLHDDGLPGDFRLEQLRPIAIGAEVDVPEEGICPTDHTPARDAIEHFREAKRQIEVVHAGESHLADAGDLDGRAVIAIAVLVGEAAEVLENLGRIQAGRVLGELPLVQAPVTLAVGADEVERVPLHVGEHPSEETFGHLELGVPRQDVRGTVFLGGEFPARVEGMSTPGIVAPERVDDRANEAVSDFLAEGLADGADCRGLAVLVDAFAETEAVVGIRNDNDRLHLGTHRAHEAAERGSETSLEVLHV